MSKGSSIKNENSKRHYYWYYPIIFVVVYISVNLVLYATDSNRLLNYRSWNWATAPINPYEVVQCLPSYTKLPFRYFSVLLVGENFNLWIPSLGLLVSQVVDADWLRFKREGAKRFFPLLIAILVPIGFTYSLAGYGYFASSSTRVSTGSSILGVSVWALVFVESTVQFMLQYAGALKKRKYELQLLIQYAAGIATSLIIIPFFFFNDKLPMSSIIIAHKSALEVDVFFFIAVILYRIAVSWKPILRL